MKFPLRNIFIEEMLIKDIRNKILNPQAFEKKQQDMNSEKNKNQNVNDPSQRNNNMSQLLRQNLNAGLSGRKDTMDFTQGTKESLNHLNNHAKKFGMQ